MPRKPFQTEGPIGCALRVGDHWKAPMVVLLIARQHRGLGK